MSKSKIGLIIVALGLLLLANDFASAGLAVGNAILEKEIAPGGNISHLMTVSTRESDPSMDIKVDVMGYGQSLDGTNIGLNASRDTGTYTARPFLKASPDSFHLDPGKSQKVMLKGDIPSDVGSGGRYALINIHSLPMGNKSVDVVLAVEVPIRLTINGSDIINKGEIESLDLVEPVSSKEQKLSLILKNTGNHHYRPMAKTVIEDQDGTIVANASSPSVYTLLPNYSRLIKIDITPEPPLKPGAYTVNATVNMDDGTVLANKKMPLEIKS